MKEETRDYILYRIQQAEESLKDAKVLFEVRHSWIGVINRSYYAAFYAASALLATKELSTSKHSGLISIIGREFVKEKIISPELGRILHRLFELRQRSDYHSPHALSREIASECIDDAEVFVSEIKEKLADSGWIVV